MIEVLAKATGVIILQYTNVSSQHIIYLKHTQCYMSIISQFLKRNFKSKNRIGKFGELEKH